MKCSVQPKVMLLVADLTKARNLIKCGLADTLSVAGGANCPCLATLPFSTWQGKLALIFRMDSGRQQKTGLAFQSIWMVNSDSLVGDTLEKLSLCLC